MANILITEDQVSIGLIYRRLLASIGHGVAFPQPGIDGIAAGGNNKTGVVFLELVHPGMKGPEVLQQSPNEFRLNAVQQRRYFQENRRENQGNNGHEF